MSLSRIKALLIEEYFITLRSLEVIVDLFLLSLMSVIVFGYFSLFLSTRVDGPGAHYLLLGMLLWEVVRVMQYSISVGAMWEVWSRNLTNLFITPLYLREYLAAAVISGGVKSALILALVSAISSILFDFDITSIGVGNLLLDFLNLSLFAIALGLVIMGIIFRYGQRIQALAWGLIFLFQPLTAVYFPVDVLPAFLQDLALLLPPTHVFESARNNLTNPATDWASVWKAAGLNLIYLGGSLVFFNLMYTGARRSGQFAKLGA